MNKKLISLSLACAIGLGMLSGCGGDGAATAAPTAGAEGSAAPASSQGAGGGAFHMNVCIASEPESIDPALNTTVDGSILANHMFEGLMKWVDSGERVEGVSNNNLAKLAPGQAESYEKATNADGTVTYTFHLRDGIKWNDGKDVTAGDFVYSWRRLATPATGAEYCYMINMVKGYDEVNGQGAEASALAVEASDDKTFVVTLSYDCPYFLEVCAFPATFPVREDIVTANPDNWTHEVSTYVTNGPYRLSEWKHNAQIVIEKNPAYYGVAELGPDTITFKLMDNDNAMLTGYNAGDLDFIEEVPVDEIPNLLLSGEMSIVPQIGTYYVCYNTEKEPFNDWRVRKAFTLAIDSQYIVDKVTQTGQVPATAFVPSGVPDAEAGSDFRETGGGYWDAPVNAGQYEKNCEEAKKLLAEAGYPNGDGFPPVTYLFNTSDNHRKIGEVLQQQWSNVLGVQVKLENQDWAVFLDSRHQGNYQIARNAWVADYSDPICFLDMWVTGGGNNDAQYSNPAYDEAVRKAQTSADPKERMQAMHEAENILMGEDWVLGPIYFYTQKYMLKEDIKGLYYTPLAYFFFGSCTRG